ncbi:MAG: hypothetical protein NTV49_11800 [Kiritimatiellaeota bacterium]|nr:hypothetical protein [Kiritimatiellota bacterium]
MMKYRVLWVAGWLTFLGATFGADQPQPEDNLPLDKPVVNKPPLSANSVMIKAQIIEAGAKSEPPPRGSGLLHTKDQKRDPNAPKSKQLLITVARICKDDLSDAVVQWRLYATDVETRKMTVAGSGEIPVALTNLASQSVTSDPPVTVKYIPVKIEQSGGNQQAGRIIRASGQRISGWAVQVFQGTTLVGEKYSDSSLKSGVEGKAAPKSTSTTIGIMELPKSTSTSMGIVPADRYKPKAPKNFN